MNINISTKYNVGDTVYLPEYYDSYIPLGPFIITDIDVKIDKDGLNIFYIAVHGEISERVIEQRCFDSYGECTKWCKEHN